MNTFIVEITLRDGTLRLEVEWTGTEFGLEHLYRQIYHNNFNVAAWEKLP
jgi:hypothetical protein